MIHALVFVAIAFASRLAWGWPLGTILFDSNHKESYHIKYQIGEGAVGEIYLAQDTQKKELVIKKLRSAFPTPEGYLLLEKRRGLSPNSLLVDFKIQKVTSELTPQAQTIIVLPYLKSVDLYDLSIANLKSRDIETNAEVFRTRVQRIKQFWIDSALALLELRSLGLSHNDFKPENVLWDDKTQRFVLNDFDLVMPSAVFCEWCTFGFIPPEFFISESRGFHRDLFALATAIGGSIYSALEYPEEVGSLPFLEIEPDAWTLKNRNALAQRRTELNNIVPDSLSETRQTLSELLQFSESMFSSDQKSRERGLRKLLADPKLSHDFREMLEKIVAALKKAPRPTLYRRALWTCSRLVSAVRD